jgi:hypothetical protein
MMAHKLGIEREYGIGFIYPLSLELAMIAASDKMFLLETALLLAIIAKYKIMYLYMITLLCMTMCFADLAWYLPMYTTRAVMSHGRMNIEIQ